MSAPPAAIRSYAAPPELDGLRRKALLVGAAGAAASLLGILLDSARFFQSYLVAWLLWLGVALGCLGVLCLHHLASGAWGMLVRRALEAAARTLPLLALLFVPLLFGLRRLYSWAEPGATTADELLRHKAGWLSAPAFTGRAVLYFAAWIACAWTLDRLSARQDRTADPALAQTLRTFAAPALGLYALAATFAAFDWLMSLDPHWFSSLFGVYFIGGHGVSAFAFIVLVALFLSRREPLGRHFERVHFHDYGKLLFAFVLLWTYFAVSQYLIIWSGNLPEEITWYVERLRGGWQVLAVALALLHFAFPFALLLSARLKQNAPRLAAVAVLLLVLRWVDLYWQTAPTFHERLTLHWLDPATVAAVGGLWLGYFFHQLGRRPLLPLGDAEVRETFDV